ncbi:MAG: hypothetical protein GTO29_08500 [Candidatus Latescibacteria bacterium]|nr:hypothetical protein [Candidatus Latescibacterota bacterium]NIO56203.1 hypothetical protein [Candidatus Latescibacterota bacterium]
MRHHTWSRAAGVVAALIAGVLCIGCSADDPNVSLEIRIVQATPADHLTKMTMIVWGGQRTYYAHDEVLLTEEDVATATVVRQVNGAPAIKLFLNREGQEKLLHVTQNNVGSKLGIIIDERLQCVSQIDAPVELGIVMVTGHMLKHGAKRCCRALTRGTA